MLDLAPISRRDTIERVGGAVRRMKSAEAEAE
jgi:hypothetical protein